MKVTITALCAAAAVLFAMAYWAFAPFGPAESASQAGQRVGTDGPSPGGGDDAWRHVGDSRDAVRAQQSHKPDASADAPNDRLESEANPVVAVVSGPGNTRLSGISVGLSDRTGYQVLGESTSEGVLALASLPAKVGDGAALVFSHPEWIACAVAVDGRSEYFVTMYPGAAIEGYVLDAAGNHAGMGVKVIGHDLGVWPGSAFDISLELAAKGDPRVVQDTTDRDGRFRLTGVAPGIPHLLVGGGQGRFTPKSVRGAIAGNGPYELVLDDLYVADLRVSASEGPLAEGYEYCLGLSSPGYFVLDKSAAQQPDSIGWLCDYETPGDRVPGPLDRLIFFGCSRDEPRVGPIRYEVSLPGYQPGRLDAFAYPMSAGAPPAELRLELSDYFKGVGGLRVDVTVEGQWDTMSSRDLGWLILDSHAEGTSPCRISVPAPPEVRTAYLPAGEYRYMFEGFNGIDIFPQEGAAKPVVVVAAGRVATIKLDLAAIGLLRIESLAMAGGPNVGFLPITIAKNEEGGGRDAGRGGLQLRVDPYTGLTDGIPLVEGTYTLLGANGVHFMSPGPDLSESANRSLGIRIKRGQEARAVIQIARD